ncbi:EAL domain-containing protein [Aurantimonas sp. MSK8Z-1]|uniref:putative bifunctional diguanylate cyclase/phosphodiesterase n=1 Tax=Mangrovibrevibacter kandeliae TaxID=2968473 RepID=UPI002117B5AA|nr:EAL domain-containing protein [Aurantimonas sp. MSK8Z-1]MCW4116021.1 EAL domain-containing protein [Aurantimonas sp. MSK8Z-1]
MPEQVADDIQALLERERLARSEAERQLESKSRELFALNQSLVEANLALEKRVQERTGALVRERESAMQLARTDQLAGLSNRLAFKERLYAQVQNAQRSGGEVGLLLIDLDHFKEINDALGHQAGDDVIVEAARRLSLAAGRGEFVARIGGDEFAVVVSGSDVSARLEAVAFGLKALLIQRVIAGESALSIRFSGGSAIYPQDCTTPGDLERFADIALYEAKRAGRNASLAFAGSMLESFHTRHQLDADLGQAIASGQIEVWYQPILGRPGCGRRPSVEALARWRHPTLGMIPPGRFIEVAETSGLIGRLGRHVLLEACVQAKAWVDADLIETVSVNMSPRQMASPDVLADVRWALEKSGLAPNHLILEITESMLFEDMDLGQKIMEDMAADGIRFALDDFGAGYSNFFYLAKLPLHRLKIDRKYTADICSDSTRNILQGLITFAQRLDLEVVSEGVETEEQHQFLLSAGIDLLQGFLFGRPQPPGELALASLAGDGAVLCPSLVPERRARAIA